jgi:hypothetical protein
MEPAPAARSIKTRSVTAARSAGTRSATRDGGGAFPSPAWELSGIPRDGPPQTLLEVASAFVRRHHKTRSSMYTVESLPFSEGGREGEVMLSWWLDAPGMLLFKQVMLLPAGGEPKGVLTTTARALLADPALRALGLRTVRVESVLKRKFLLHLETVGWVLEGRAYGGGDANLSGNADMRAPAGET